MRFILPRYPNKSIVLGEESKPSLSTQILIGFSTSVAATLALYYAGFFDGQK
jgi:hypothetical protein